MNVRAFLRWAGVNVLLGSWDNYFATPANYYLYNSGDGPNGVHEPSTSSSSVGLRQQLRDRLLRDPVAVHRHRRLAEQHERILGKAGRQDVPHSARAEPSAQSRLVPVLPGPSGAPARHRVHPDAVLGRSDRTAGAACGTASAMRRTSRPTPLSAAVHRAAVHQRRGLPHRLQAKRDTQGTGATPRASSTTCGCAATARARQLARPRKDYPSGGAKRRRPGRWSRCRTTPEAPGSLPRSRGEAIGRLMKTKLRGALELELCREAKVARPPGRRSERALRGQRRRRGRRASPTSSSTTPRRSAASTPGFRPRPTSTTADRAAGTIAATRATKTSPTTRPQAGSSS